MIIENVEIMWPKLSPNNPDMGFDKKSPNWCVNFITRDEDRADEWIKAGLTVKTKTDDKGDYYEARARKDKFIKKGENKPVAVYGPDAMVYSEEEIAKIGNGTVANVKLWTGEYNWNGKKGTSFRLDAIQILELKEYLSNVEPNHGFKSVVGNHPSNPPIVEDDDDDDDDM